jgi:hypothetical protein
MVTNYLQGLTAARPIAIGARDRDSMGILARAGLWVKQTTCGLQGHDALMHFEQDRVTLVCTSCGHESPGWEIGDRRPRRRFEGDAARHLLRPAPVLVARKSA